MKCKANQFYTKEVGVFIETLEELVMGFINVLPHAEITYEVWNEM